MKQPVTLTEAECVTCKAALHIARERYLKNAAFCNEVEQTFIAQQFLKQAEEAKRLILAIELALNGPKLTVVE